MATTMCEIDGVRPAVATVRISQNGEERTIAVCEEHLRELVHDLLRLLPAADAAARQGLTAS